MRNPLSSFLSRLVSPTKEKLTSFVSYSNNQVTGLENFTDSRSLNSYKDSLYLYIAVSKIAKRMASIPLELHRIKGSKGDTEEVFDHEILDLFYNPNDFQTQRVFLETSCAHYLLSGDVFWYINRDENSMVTIRPDQMAILLSPDNKRIIAYEHRAGTVTKFKPEDIVHIQNPDPTNILRGVGAVRPAHVRILTEKAAGEYQANFLKNQGRPDVAVFVDGPVDDEKGTAARAKWKQTFGGNNGGSAGFFGSNIKSIQELNKTPVEMGLMDTQNFLRDDILAALGVPKAMVTSDDVNKSNAAEAYRMFLQEAVVPVMDAFIDVINNRLLTTYDPALFFSYDDPTPNDRELMLKETTELKKNGIITANEARATYDYEAMEGGDSLSTASVRPEVQQEAKAIIRRRPILAKTLRAKELTVEALLAAHEPKRHLNSIFPTRSLKEGYAKAYNKRVDKKAEGLKEAIDAFHGEQLKRILDNDLTADGFMDLQGEKIAAKARFTPILHQLYKDGGQAALDAVFKKSADNFWADEVLLAAISARADFFTNSMTDTTYAILQAKILDGLKNGDGPDKIAGGLRDYFDDMTKGRSETIARTETGYTLSKASHDAYQQSSVITGMEWISVGDSKVRPEHQENDGKIIAKGGTFPSGESYPAEHSINCRCSLAPTV